MDWFSVDRSSPEPLIRQVYAGIRNAMFSGKLQPGDKLPSTRELARRIGVSRNVAMEAYDMLFAEGFVVGSKGSGTYVAEGTRFDRRLSAGDADRSAAAEAGRSAAARAPATYIDFRTGEPDKALFPREPWLRCYNQAIRQAPAELFKYQPAEGSYALRSAIASYLRRMRGIVCEPERIVVTNGAAQSFWIAAKLLLSPDRAVVVEDPSGQEIRRTYSSFGARIDAVPVDRDGLRTSLLPADGRVAFVHVTPSHQYPLGGVMPIQRRIELLNYARSTGAYILEDDYDSEFRYEGQPVSAMVELDPERVIYVGTFSKTLSPALRIGYAVLPEALVAPFRHEKWTMDVHSNALEQEALALFVEDGHLERHIRKSRHAYRKKQQLLLKLLNETFDGRLECYGTSTGLHLTIRTQALPTLHAPTIVNGVKLYPIRHYAVRTGDERANEWLFGFGHLSEREIEAGAERLAQVRGAVEITR